MLPATRSLALTPRRPDSLEPPVDPPPPANDVDDDTSFSLTPSLSLLRAVAPNLEVSRSETRVLPPICRDDEDDVILEPSSFLMPSLPERRLAEVEVVRIGATGLVILKEGDA